MALTTLVNDRGARYQVCGPNAFYRYGWDTQVPNRLYAYNNRSTGQRMVGSVAMTLNWSRFNSLPQGYDWIRAELGQDPAIASEIARVAMRYGNISTLRRLGRQLERAGAAPTVLGSLESRLSPSSALIPWVPTLPPATNDDRGVLLRQPGGGIDTAGRGHKTQFWRVHVVSSTMDVARPNYRFVPGGFAREIHFVCLRVVAVARESSPGRR